jgi:hypothetical protein
MALTPEQIQALQQRSASYVPTGEGQQMQAQGSPYGRYNPTGVLDLPEDRMPIDPDTGMPIYDPRDPDGRISRRFEQDAAQIIAGGERLDQAAGGAMDYWGNRMTEQGDLADRAYGELYQTPGYTPGEASQINVDYGQYRTPEWAMEGEYLSPQEQDWYKGAYGDAQRKAEQGNESQGAMLNQYQRNLSGQVGNYGRYTDEGLGELSGRTDSSIGRLRGGLDDAQGGFAELDSAVYDPSLEFDPSGSMKQLTDTDVNAIKTAAGRRVGNMYQNEADNVTRAASAGGPVSPMAVAAARARLANSSAAMQGDAEADANIAALQAQFDRAAGIEDRRIGAAQTRTGMRAQAATTKQSQAQRAAELAGMADLEANQNVGSQYLAARQRHGDVGIDAANQYGQFSTGTAGEMGDRSTGAAFNYADANRDVILNNQQSRSRVNDMRYGQGVDTAQMTSGGAQTVGNARREGGSEYRSGVAGQQELAQRGGQDALNTRANVYGTRTGALTANTGNRAQYENTGPGALGKMGNALLGAVTSVGTSYAGRYNTGKG